MKLRALVSHVSAASTRPWYRHGMGAVLSCSFLLPLSAWAADPVTPAAPAAAATAVADDDEQELAALRQLAQQMLTRIDALERKQRAKKGLPALPDRPASEVAATPVAPPVPVAPPAPPPPPIRITPKSFEFSGNTVFSAAQLNSAVAADIGKEVDYDGLQDIVDKVKLYYRGKGYFLALAQLPAREIVDGVIHIEVLEGRIGKIHTKTPLPAGATITEAQFKGMIGARLKEGDLITESTLEGPLLQLRDLPGVDVRSTINPGSQNGTADIDLEIVPVASGKRITTNVEIDNAGNRFAGEYRGTLRSTLNGVFGIGDSLSFNGTLGYSPVNIFGRIGYLAPVGYSGTRAGINLSRLNYLLGKDFAALRVEGNATIAEFLMVHPFIRGKEYNLFGQASIEHKSLSDKQLTVPTQRRDIDSLKFGFNGDLRGAASLNTGSLDLVLGHLKFKTEQDLTDDQSGNGYHTAGTFLKLNFNVNRLQTLAPKYEALFALSGQIASKNLTSAEKFVLGGPGRVRGYPSGEAGGDQGFVATGELRYSVPDFNMWGGKLALSTFVDYGWVARNRDAGHSPFGDNLLANHRSLYSAGIGFNLGAPDQFVFRSDLAWGLSGASTSDTKARSPRLWFQGVKWF